MTNTKTNGDNMVAVEKTQLMEGDDAPPATFKWTIEGFSKLTNNKKYSEIFYLGGVGWRLLIFPKGNKAVKYVSIYLDAVDSETISQDGWSIDAQFSLTVINQIDDKLKVEKEFKHKFNAGEQDWGFKEFMLLTDLNDRNKGYLVKDTCIIEVVVTVKSVVPPKKTTKLPSETQSLKRKKSSLDFFKEPPSKNVCSSAPRVLHTDHTESAKATQSEQPPKQIDVSSSNGKSPTLFHHFGSLKVRNPPYSLPNGCRLVKGAVLDEGNMAAQLIQSALLSSELQSLVELPAVDLENQGYFHLAKFLHYHCASIISAQGLQTKHQEHANVLEEIKRRDLEIQTLQVSLVKSSQEASQLQGDLEKVKEEKAKVADEFSAAKEKIINLEGELHKVEDELQLLRSENVDLQIQLEDARQAEQTAATRAVEDFKTSSEYDNELRAMAFDGLEQATVLACARLKIKLPGFEPSMLDNLAQDAHASLTNEADAAD